MKVTRAVVWVSEGTWEASVDAVAQMLPDDCEITLLHVTPPDAVEVAAGAAAGLLGRHRPPDGPERELVERSERAAAELLEAAAQRLGRAAASETRIGRPEREVLDAAGDADVLVLARDRDPSRPGPHSIGPATRFVLDHAACAVLLVWMPGGPQSRALPPDRRHHRPGHPPPPPHGPPPSGPPPHRPPRR